MGDYGAATQAGDDKPEACSGTNGTTTPADCADGGAHASQSGDLLAGGGSRGGDAPAQCSLGHAPSLVGATDRLTRPNPIKLRPKDAG